MIFSRQKEPASRAEAFGSFYVGHDQVFFRLFILFFSLLFSFLFYFIFFFEDDVAVSLIVAQLIIGRCIPGAPDGGVRGGKLWRRLEVAKAEAEAEAKRVLLVHIHVDMNCRFPTRVVCNAAAAGLWVD